MAQNSFADIPTTANSKPKHVAIIMDGNNRWAKCNNKTGIAGHRAGVGAVRAVVEVAVQEELEVLTLFAFSSENWRRPKEEVSALMKLFLVALQREVRKLHRHNVRLKIVGDISGFNPVLQEHIARSEALTAQNDGLTLVIAANYGGRWDITQASRAVALDVASGKLSVDQIDEALIQSRLCLGDFPMPDLMIRTAGECRISNFMLWQLAYTEFYFSDVYWPDFKQEHMHLALNEYTKRKRRFGQTDDQIDG